MRQKILMLSICSLFSVAYAEVDDGPGKQMAQASKPTPDMKLGAKTKASPQKQDNCPKTLTAEQVRKVALEGSPEVKTETRNVLETNEFKLRFVSPSFGNRLTQFRWALNKTYINGSFRVNSEWTLKDDELLGGKEAKQYLCTYENKDVNTQYRKGPSVPKSIQITSIVKSKKN